MRYAIGFLLPLLLFLAALAWGATALLNTTGRRWFEKDVAMRSQLAANGAREALVLHWKDTRRATRVLTDLAKDERVMAATTCNTDGVQVAATREYPKGLGCELVRLRVGTTGRGWDEVQQLATGRVHVSGIPIREGEELLGYLVLLHDLTFADRREAATRQFLLIAIAVVAAAASLVTVMTARVSWRSWTDELRRLLRGDSKRRDFKPVLSDVRELIMRLAEERANVAAGHWSPERLRQALTHHLQGEGVILVANREPYIHDRTADGSIQVRHPASGLVTAVEPVMRACSGVWIAHGSGSADREVSDRQGRVHVPPGEESYTLKHVWLEADEEKGYYYGFSNEGLWPLCHVAHTRPVFRAQDWEYYQRVNRKFADAVCAEAQSDDPIVLVQDYHFALLPRLVRERLGRATIITFWHVPWPNSELFGICPWYQEILHGLLGSSILGFHTQYHCNHFIDAVDRYLEARIDREQQAVVLDGQPTLVRAYPISVEWPSRWTAEAPSIDECRTKVRQELGLTPATLLGVGVDRLDYTKGIEERLMAVERLLDNHPEFRERFSFAQVAAPSRTAIDRYRDLNNVVEALAVRINGRFASGTWRPIVLLRKHHEAPEIFRFYRAADLCYVSSLHDGMNLVAKEFVAARDDSRGVLVLSRFTGAARELTEALLVNPYDLEEASEALVAALTMPVRDQEERMRSMRALVGEFNVYRWAGKMLVDAARLRRRDRVAIRLLEKFQRKETIES